MRSLMEIRKVDHHRIAGYIYEDNYGTLLVENTSYLACPYAKRFEQWGIYLCCCPVNIKTIEDVKPSMCPGYLLDKKHCIKYKNRRIGEKEFLL